MSAHPLLVAFRTYIQDEYSERVGKVKNAEQKAMTISRMGIDYNTYVELAVKLNHKWAMKQGWKYPYWNLIVSDNTLERVRQLVGLNDVGYQKSNSQNDYESEMLFASSYVEWYLNGGDRPRRFARADENIKTQVAETLCSTYGVACISSNYNTIAQEINKIHG